MLKTHKYIADVEAYEEFFDPSRPIPRGTCSFWGAIAGAVVGKVLNRSSEKRAQAAQDSQSEALNAQAQLGRDQWDRYVKVYGPTEENLVRQANEGVSPEAMAERAAADVDSGFAKTREVGERQMARYGLNPASPAAIAARGNTNIEQSKARALGMNTARLTADDINFNRKATAVGMGKGLPAVASASLSGAAAGFGRMADQYANDMAGTGRFVGGISNKFGNWAGDKISNWWSNRNGGNNDMAAGLAAGASGGFYADGGLVEGPGNGTSDSVPATVDGQEPARLSNGEYVIPANVVRQKGVEFFDKLVGKYPSDEQPRVGMRGYAKGGYVTPPGVTPGSDDDNRMRAEYDRSVRLTESAADKNVVPGARQVKSGRDRNDAALQAMGG